MRQKNIDSYIKKQINNFHEAPSRESKSERGTFTLTASQKIALKQIAEQQGTGVSQLVSAAIELYLDLMPHGDLLKENLDIITPLIERLR